MLLNGAGGWKSSLELSDPQNALKHCEGSIQPQSTHKWNHQVAVNYTQSVQKHKEL